MKYLLTGRIPYHKEGGFGYIRKHDIHTGVDIYCKPGAPIEPLYQGIITNIVKFTGFAESPWWNDTYAVLVYHPSIDKTIVYGEILPTLNLNTGNIVEDNTLLGGVLTVLKEDKGKPMTMLHLELLEGYQTQPAEVWRHNTSKQQCLLNPTEFLIKHSR
jgi:hypothetical protein